MITFESMSRRACINGDEIDYLADAKAHHLIHGVHAKAKSRRNKRVRRQVRADLRTGRYDG